MTDNLQVSVNTFKRPTITTDMLVQDIQGNVGLVIQVTSKWVHIVVLIRAKGLGFDDNYHGTIRHQRKSLTILPAGYKLQIKQKAI